MTETALVGQKVEPLSQTDSSERQQLHLTIPGPGLHWDLIFANLKRKCFDGGVWHPIRAKKQQGVLPLKESLALGGIRDHYSQFALTGTHVFLADRGEPVTTQECEAFAHSFHCGSKVLEH
jgi:hypothetical protein